LVFRPYLSGGWGRVTFRECGAHLAVVASLRDKQWSNLGFKVGDVVGVWLTGRKYEDLVNVLGICGAGYIPQLFSSNFPNPAVVFDLLSRSGAKALVFDDAFKDIVATASVPTIPSLTITDIEALLPVDGSIPAVTSLPPVEERGTAFIIHSSGTTSGTPKLIPSNHLWVKTFAQLKYASCLEQGSFEGQSICNSIGNLNHVGSLCAFLGAAYNGTCTVQCSSMDFSTDELLAMITQCSLNRVLLYATFLSTHIRNAQKDRKVLQAMQGLRQILHTGVAFNRDDEEWAFAHNLPLTTSYGLSEASQLLTSVLGPNPSDRLLRPVNGAGGQMVPTLMQNDDQLGQPTLYEIVVPASAPDSPHTSFLSEDGVYHTGDVFEEVEKGLYIFRGRCDDWLKTPGGFCDTKATEDEVRKTCADLVYDAVVVGIALPAPVLLVESVQACLNDEERLHIAEQIVHRLNPFNERLFMYERINDPKRVLIMEQGSLPRTKEKGNIRRRAAEDLFSGELNAIHA